MTNQTYPPIQIVNEKDEPAGEAAMYDAYDQGLIYRIVYVVVEDEAGRILLQKRSQKVATSPNCWDISVGGHVDAGEPYEAAAERELREELGFTEPVKLQTLSKFYEESEVNNWLLKRFNTVFKVVLKADAKFNPHPDEVSEVKWLDVDSIKRLIAEHPDQVASGLVTCIQQYFT